MEYFENGSYTWYGTDHYRWRQIPEREIYAPQTMHVFERITDQQGNFRGPSEDDLDHMFYCMKIYSAPIKLPRHHVYFFGYKIQNPFTGHKLFYVCLYFKSIFNMIEE